MMHASSILPRFQGASEGISLDLLEILVGSWGIFGICSLAGVPSIELHS